MEVSTRKYWFLTFMWILNWIIIPGVSQTVLLQALATFQYTHLKLHLSTRKEDLHKSFHKPQRKTSSCSFPVTNTKWYSNIWGGCKVGQIFIVPHGEEERKSKYVSTVLGKEWPMTYIPCSQDSMPPQDELAISGKDTFCCWPKFLNLDNTHMAARAELARDGIISSRPLLSKQWQPSPPSFLSLLNHPLKKRKRKTSPFDLETVFNLNIAMICL